MRSLLRCAVSRSLARLLIVAVMASTMPVEASYGVRERRLVTQDELGNRLVQRDANGNETRFEYDKLGREVARMLPDGARESKTYDATGSLETWTDFIGRTTTFGYDVNSRLTSKSFQSGRSVGFTYSVTGRRLTATDARGTTTFGYDNRDRLTSIAQPRVGSLGFTYNANGARETMTATVGSDALTTTYGYDDGNRLDTVQDHLGRTYDFDWDPNGNRERLALPNGVETNYQYSPLNRLTQLSASGPLGAVFSQAFTLGLAGNRTRIDELNGVSRVYTYDDLYRLTSETVNSGADLNYSRNWTYDAVGNRQQQVSAVGPAGTPGPNLQAGTVDYTYDSRDRLLTEVFGAATTTHSYDANGNLVTKSGELTLTWDEENRLIRMEKPNGTVIQTDYDADGVRVRTTTTLPGQAAEVVDFLVDTSGGLSHVVAEVTPAGLRAVYVRGGDDLLSVIRPSTTAASGWESRFYTTDGIGSVRNLTDEAGMVTDTYSTTAFGELLSHQGGDPQPYLFAGEPYDPNIGMAYHRARWMLPAAGIFASLDPATGDYEQPMTNHRYMYVGHDPVGRVDPTGLFFGVAETLTALSLANLVVSIPLLSAGAFVPPQQFVPLRPKDEAKIRNATKEVIDLVPSRRFEENVITPLAKALPFSLADFQTFLKGGVQAYDGLRSTAPIEGTIYARYAARAFLNKHQLPAGATVRDFFNQRGGTQTNAFTSFTSPTMLTFFRASAIGGRKHARALVFHEGLHALGASRGGTTFHDLDIEMAFFGKKCADTSCITKHIESQF